MEWWIGRNDGFWAKENRPKAVTYLAIVNVGILIAPYPPFANVETMKAREYGYKLLIIKFLVLLLFNSCLVSVLSNLIKKRCSRLKSNNSVLMEMFNLT